LATKAIWALGSIRDNAAHRALESLACSEDSIVATGAKAQPRDDRSLAGSGSGRPYERFEILGKRIGLFGQPGTRARSQSPVSGLLTLAGLLTPDST